jgi:3-oxoacyl-(acyl-carrier-protein) synthase
VGGINAHGTGTVFNDAMEMYAFSQLWATPPPFHSVKGAIGHCLGAAGIIESAIAIKSLHEGKIPPTVGLERPEARIAKVIAGEAALPLTSGSILTCNSGFGGINAALLFDCASREFHRHI